MKEIFIKKIKNKKLKIKKQLESSNFTPRCFYFKEKLEKILIKDFIFKETPLLYKNIRGVGYYFSKT